MPNAASCVHNKEPLLTGHLSIMAIFMISLRWPLNVRFQLDLCMHAVLSDIFYECHTKNIGVRDQMSDRKYKNIHLVDEKKQNTSDYKGKQLGFKSSRCFYRHS